MNDSYPTDRKRSGYFARFSKALFASDAIRDYGSDVVLLTIFIASREDKLHYSRAPQFWRSELMDRFNKTSPNWFVRVRTVAIDIGLLHYSEATRTKPGTYWTLVPEWLKPTFEAYEKHTAKGEAYEIHTANDTAKHTANDTHSIPVTQYPINTAPTASESSSKKKTKAVKGFEDWYSLYPKKVAKADAEKAYPKAIAEICKTDSVEAGVAAELLMRWTQERTPSLMAADERYRPHPASWLSARRYRDALAATATKENIPPVRVGNYKRAEPKRKVRA
jgi:hypothetical protein